MWPLLVRVEGFRRRKSALDIFSWAVATFNVRGLLILFCMIFVDSLGSLSPSQGYPSYLPRFLEERILIFSVGPGGFCTSWCDMFEQEIS